MIFTPAFSKGRRFIVENVYAGVDKLSPYQKFIFEYGFFLLTWNRFEYLVEALIWYLETKVLGKDKSALDYYRETRTMESWRKRSRVEHLLRYTKQRDVYDAVVKIYEVADRNGWVHDLILALRWSSDRSGDDVHIARLTAEKGREGISGKPVDLNSPFKVLHDAVKEFEDSVEKAFDSTDLGVDYLNATCKVQAFKQANDAGIDKQR